MGTKKGLAGYAESFAKKQAMNFAMKKLGLGFLNPFLGIASLFKGSKFDPFTGGKKPDMSAFNKLGLQANRVPTQTTDIRTAKARDAYRQSISTQIAGGKGLESGAELLGLKKQDTSGIEGQQAKLVGPALTQMRVLQKKQEMEQRNKDLGIEAPKFNPKDQRMLDKLREMDKEDKVYKMPILTAAYGGRIDRPLMGRSRDI